MQVVTYTEANNSLKAVLDSVTDNDECVVIDRRGSGNAVVMSQSYFNSLMETVHLLKSPANSGHLEESIQQHRAGETVQKDMEQ